MSYLSVVTFVLVNMQQSPVESFRIPDVVCFSITDLSLWDPEKPKSDFLQGVCAELTSEPGNVTISYLQRQLENRKLCQCKWHRQR